MWGFRYQYSMVQDESLCALLDLALRDAYLKTRWRLVSCCLMFGNATPQQQAVGSVRTFEVQSCMASNTHHAYLPYTVCSQFR